LFTPRRGSEHSAYTLDIQVFFQLLLIPFAETGGKLVPLQPLAMAVFLS
jgi:hypothetical protein